MDRACFAPGANDAEPLQACEVLRQCRGAETDPQAEFSNAHFTLAKLAENEQAVSVGERLEQAARPIRCRRHHIGLHFHSCEYTELRI